MNTVIIPHRNRPEHLLACLKSLYATDNPPEVIVVDSSDIPLPQTSAPTSQIIPFPHDSPYWKSRALNIGISHVKTEILTVLDVDIVVEPDFNKTVEEYFAESKNHQKKLGHRVRLLDPTTSRNIIANGPTWPITHPTNFAPEYYRHIHTGNAVHSIRLDLHHKIGPYDERFRGWGLEDVEWNLRASQFCETEILYEHNTYHLAHRRASDWETEPQCTSNRRLFFQLVQSILGKE